VAVDPEDNRLQRITSATPFFNLKPMELLSVVGQFAINNLINEMIVEPFI
jgi:hypothetical protein